ncbi:methyltransferase [Ciceribacter sp. L1K22]|uniref:class I SAM-dependent methyltransferase n=1 Tax=Ciceribacter sp. L1K22 TaxID=2820275 RepID=UPI001ABE71A5|nr:methyltransferase [Ciceribacter sp. L1K22]MBO3762483.1 methyltransferase [Ciceribacter sp. L1K22]
MRTEPERFILGNTSVLSPPHVPEIQLHLASEVHDLWQKTEEDLEAIGLPPPFWAFAWAGGQGLARYLLDHPEKVRGKKVLDFASGSGLVAIAAAVAGASDVTASDIDPWSRSATKLNCSLNDVSVTFSSDDLLGKDVDFDVVLAGDVFYDAALAGRIVSWFEYLAAKGVEILVGDPGRTYLPKTRLAAVAVYEVPVSRVLEDSEVKKTTVWRFS